MHSWPFEFNAGNQVEKHIWEHEESVSSIAAMSLEPLHKIDASSVIGCLPSMPSPCMLKADNVEPAVAACSML